MAGPTLARPERSSNFYFAFLFLSREQREALSAVYAFCREVDDAVDEEGGAAALERWRGELAAVYGGKPGTETGRRLKEAVARFRLPREPFEDIVRGAAMDLDIRRYRSFEGLEPYLFRVSSSVGLLCVDIFGLRTDSATEYARWLGYAFQLTNILRDVGEDLGRGRIYLPLAELERFGYSEADLRAMRRDAAFQSAMEYQYRRARACYDRARAALDPAERAAALPAEVMAGVYERLLEKLRDGGWNVFDRRTELSAPEKLIAAAGAWWRVKRGA